MKMLTVPLLVCVMMALTGADAASCPDGWTEISGRCFIYVSTPMNWWTAEESCLSQGANLASVHNDEDYQAIRAMIKTAANVEPLTWLGGYDAVHEGTWFWSDGSPFDFDNWANGEPNNVDSEQCLNMNSGADKKFNDLGCIYGLPSVCAKNQQGNTHQ